MASLESTARVTKEKVNFLESAILEADAQIGEFEDLVKTQSDEYVDRVKQLREQVAETNEQVQQALADLQREADQLISFIDSLEQLAGQAKQEENALALEVQNQLEECEQVFQTIDDQIESTASDFAQEIQDTENLVAQVERSLSDILDKQRELTDQSRVFAMENGKSLGQEADRLKDHLQSKLVSLLTTELQDRADDMDSLKQELSGHIEKEQRRISEKVNEVLDLVKENVDDKLSEVLAQGEQVVQSFQQLISTIENGVDSLQTINSTAQISVKSSTAGLTLAVEILDDLKDIFDRV